MKWRNNWLLWLCILVMFGAIAGGLGPEFIAAARSYTWRAVPCTVLQSRVAEEPYGRDVTHYVLKVEYVYTFDGREYQSSRFTTGSRQGSTDPAKAEKAALRFVPGTRASCHVNPRRPEEAVLERGQLWGVLILLGPFLIVGLVMHESILAWFDRRLRRERILGDPPLSDANDALRLDLRVILFGVLGLVMGLFFLGFSLATPLRDGWRARRWVERDALITRCELTSRSGIHGPEYSLELRYEYDFGGRHYHSSRRGLGMAIDEPVADLSQWAAAHPAGTRVRCILNPGDPSESVLETSFHVGWITLALSLLMSGFGITMFAQLWQTRRLRRLSGAALQEYCTGKRDSRPIRLRVSPPPWALALACLLAVPPFGAAGLWSLQKGVRALLDGHGDIINLLYGAGATGAAVWCAVLSNRFIRLARRPRPVLRLTPATPRVGEPFQLEWTLPGARGSVNWLRVWLEGTEHAKVRELYHGHYGPVSEEKTRLHVFDSRLLADHEEADCEAGRLTGAVSADVMHSFRGAKCGVSWRLRTEFGRDDYEKLEYKFPVVVLPRIS